MISNEDRLHHGPRLRSEQPVAQISDKVGISGEMSVELWLQLGKIDLSEATVYHNEPIITIGGHEYQSNWIPDSCSSATGGYFDFQLLQENTGVGIGIIRFSLSFTVGFYLEMDCALNLPPSYTPKRKQITPTKTRDHQRGAGQ